MSVVSAKIGIVPVPLSRRVKTAVQLNKNDSGEPEPSDYTQGQQLPNFNLSKRIRIPALNLEPLHKGENVPCKFLQQGAEYSLWDTDTPNATPPLNVYAPEGRSMNVAVEQFGANVSLAPPIMYNAGIRGDIPRPIKFDVLDEPTPALFRTGKPSGRGHWGVSMTYDVGVPELREMKGIY